jgi:hypothetical protein
MSALNASVLQTAQGNGTLGDFVNNTPTGWFLTFGVIAACLGWLGLRWVTRPLRKKKR